MDAFLALIAAGKVTRNSSLPIDFSIAHAEKAYGLMERAEPHLAMLLTYEPQHGASIDRQIRLTRPLARTNGSRVAFIGLGNYAKGVLLPAVCKTEGVTLTTVVTSTGISAGHAGEKHGFAVIAYDPAAVLADADTDTVFIATRHDTHARLAADALRAGKHVFCEKPLALDPEGLSNVIAAAEATSGVLTVGFNRRFAPLMIKAKAALEPRSGPLVMLYRINAGTVPADSWIQQEEGGGRIVGEVCHFVDALTFPRR